VTVPFHSHLVPTVFDAQRRVFQANLNSMLAISPLELLPLYIGGPKAALATPSIVSIHA
jgi:hypothetical protein